MRMSEIGAQPRHVTGNIVPIGPALFEGSKREVMAHIMQARPGLPWWSA